MGLRERESEDTDVIHVIHEAGRTMSRRMEKPGRIKCDTESSFPSASENKHDRLINIEVGKRKITIFWNQSPSLQESGAFPCSFVVQTAAQAEDSPRAGQERMCVGLQRGCGGSSLAWGTGLHCPGPPTVYLSQQLEETHRGQRLEKAGTCRRLALETPPVPSSGEKSPLSGSLGRESQESGRKEGIPSAKSPPPSTDRLDAVLAAKEEIHEAQLC